MCAETFFVCEKSLQEIELSKHLAFVDTSAAAFHISFALWIAAVYGV